MIRDLILRSPAPAYGPSTDVAVAMRRAETAVAVEELGRWHEKRVAQIKIQARGEVSEFALKTDLGLYDLGMELAGDDPVRQELVLRQVQDQNYANRADVQAAFR